MITCLLIQKKDTSRKEVARVIVTLEEAIQYLSPAFFIAKVGILVMVVMIIFSLLFYADARKEMKELLKFCMEKVKVLLYYLF